MKKLLIFIAVLTLSFTLTGCGEYNELPDEITMDMVDDYLGRDDVQYIDLRNLDERMKAGYIEGFEVIPYFDYLKYQGILVDADGDWVYDTGEIGSQATMEQIFNKDKTIFLMCGSGTRARYVMEALESIGYTNIINVGGFTAYLESDKENIVLGGASWAINLDVKGDYTPGTYVGESEGYFVVVTINAEGGIGAVYFDAVSCSVDSNDDGTKDSNCTTKQILGDAYNMAVYGGARQEWYLQANELAAAIVANQGWDTLWVIADGHFDVDYADDPDTTEVDESVVGDVYTVDAVGGVSVSIGGFEAALLDALTQATPE